MNQPPRRKTAVYVDGFNLYYGVRGFGAKWLDLSKLCAKLLTQNDIVSIKYFTARVQSRLGDEQIHVRQQAYLRALRTIPNLEIIFGHFLTTEVPMVRADQKAHSTGKQKKVLVIKTEEKGSDVNIATHLLMDGFKDRYDVAAVLSNDSDLCLPIELARKDLGKTVGTICPHERPARKLIQVASFYKPIKPEVLKDCLFPDTIRDAHGTIHKPKGW